MAVESITRCDSPDCGSTETVGPVTVVRGRKAWEVDLCDDDYDYWFGELQKVSRKATRTNVKPRATFQVTKVGRDEL
ncbi:MAG: hypothetical protein ACYCZR_03030 [Burkholderiales bacterium]